jgi:hypothetical protein
MMPPFSFLCGGLSRLCVVYSVFIVSRFAPLVKGNLRIPPILRIFLYPATAPGGNTSHGYLPFGCTFYIHRHNASDFKKEIINLEPKG